MDKVKTKGFFIKVTDEEIKIIESLKNKHAINISQFLRNALINHYHKLERTK